MSPTRRASKGHDVAEGQPPDPRGTVPESSPVAAQDLTSSYPVRAVAERLGIPTATLRSWTRRYGIGPYQHRPGHHRGYTETDIAVVAHMHELIRQGARPASAARTALEAFPVPPPADPELLVAAAWRLDGSATARIVDDYLRHYRVIATWESLCRPALAEIEQRQSEGEGCIDVEHLLSWTVVRAFQRVPVHPGEAPVSVVLACTEQETHALPLEALRAALSEREIGVLMLGAAVPPSALADALARHTSAPAVVLWAQTRRTAQRAAIRAATDAGAELVLAGPGWEAADRPPTATWVDSLGDALDRFSAESE